MTEFKDRLKEALEIKKIKPSSLAEMTGLSRGLISHYLKGTYKAKQDKLYLIAVTLNVSPSWLMGMDVPMVWEQPIKNDINALIEELNADELKQVYEMLKIMFPAKVR